MPARMSRRPLSSGTAAAKRRAASEFEKRGQEATNRGPARVWTSLRVSFWDKVGLFGVAGMFRRELEREREGRRERERKGERKKEKKKEKTNLVQPPPGRDFVEELDQGVGPDGCGQCRQGVPAHGGQRGGRGEGCGERGDLREWGRRRREKRLDRVRDRCRVEERRRRRLDCRRCCCCCCCSSGRRCRDGWPGRQRPGSGGERRGGERRSERCRD